MKKALSLVILIICLFVIYQYTVTFLKKDHEIDYTIHNNDLNFSVHENFKNGKYFFQISVNHYSFYIEQENSFNKMRQVIETIDTVEKDGMLCIYPNFKGDIRTTITCHDQTKMYAYESVKTKPLVVEFLQSLKEKGKQPIFVKTISNKEEKSGNIIYYPETLDETIAIWTYQGFSALSNERTLNESPLSFDRYENSLSRFVDQYYVLPLYMENRLYEFSTVEVFDVTSNMKETIELGTTLSNYTYVNGIVDSRLYLFDPRTMQQIEINPKRKSAKTVNGNADALYYFEGEWSTRNIYDFANEQITFQNFDITPIQSKYSFINVFDNNDSYYIYDGSKIYQVYKDFLEIPKLIFEQTGMKNIKVIDGYIYYILGNTLYKYTPNEERREIVKYDEFSYNSSNLYDVYRK